MSANDRCDRRLSTTPTLPSPAHIKTGFALFAALLVTTSGLAQSTQSAPQPDPNAAPQNPVASAAAPDTTTLTVPAGTRIALVLTQPIQTRYIHRGDDIYAQIVSPVTSGNDVAIPPGTFVQGKVDKLERRGGRAELRLQSMAITFPDGYTMPIPGPMTLESDDGYAFKDPGSGRMVGAFALPAAGVGIGALIGHSTANSQPTTITSTLPPNCGVPTPGCTNGTSQSLTTPAAPRKAPSLARGSAEPLAWSHRSRCSSIRTISSSTLAHRLRWCCSSLCL